MYARWQEQDRKHRTIEKEERKNHLAAVVYIFDDAGPPQLTTLPHTAGVGDVISY